MSHSSSFLPGPSAEIAIGHRLAAAEAAGATARAHITRSDPRLWGGRAASGYRTRRDQALTQLDLLSRRLDLAQQALAAYRAERAALAAALTPGAAAELLPRGDVVPSPRYRMAEPSGWAAAEQGGGAAGRPAARWS